MRTLRGPRKRIKLLPPHLNYLQVVLLLVYYHDLELGLERRPMSAPTIQHTDHAARFNGVDAFFCPMTLRGLVFRILLFEGVTAILKVFILM